MLVSTYIYYAIKSVDSGVPCQDGRTDGQVFMSMWPGVYSAGFTPTWPFGSAEQCTGLLQTGLADPTARTLAGRKSL